MSRPPQAARPPVTAPPPPPPRTAASSSDGFISLGAMRVAAPILSTQASRQPRQSSTAHGVSTRLPVSGASAPLHAHHQLPAPSLSSTTANTLKPANGLGGTSNYRASISSSSGARGARASASSAVQPYSSALISAAFQEQFMRDLRLDFRAPTSSSHSNHAGAVSSPFSLPSQADSNSHPQALAQRIGLQGVLQHTQQLLHLSHAAGSAPVASLGAAEWAAAREQSRRRGDSALPCAICHDDFGTAAQCLLSCTHTFHLSCITSFERFTGSLSCPLCRHTPYERRPIDDGLQAHRFKHAVRHVEIFSTRFCISFNNENHCFLFLLDILCVPTGYKVGGEVCARARHSFACATPRRRPIPRSGGALSSAKWSASAGTCRAWLRTAATKSTRCLPRLMGTCTIHAPPCCTHSLEH
jgi:hypothetical protein